MLIDIKDIAREGLAIDRVLPIGSLKVEGEEPIRVGQTRVSAFLSAGRRGVDFACEMESSLELECVRCLQPFVMPLLSDFHLVLVGRMPLPSTGEAQLGEEDCEIYPVSEGKVDLGQIVREQIYLSIPLKPLCRDSCEGLCHRCGAYLNVAPCGCEPQDNQPISSPSIVLFPREPKR